MTLKSELFQRPFLQVVLVEERLEVDVLQTLLVANGLSKVFKH